MEVKTIYVNYDIKRMRPPNLIAFTHENDKNTQVIELHLTDSDEPMTLAADYTYTAAIVNGDTKALINDSIDCELNEGGNVLIPIDNLHVRGRQSIKIELTVTDEQGEQVLSLPFPIWVKVSGSILDDAQVTPESIGTVPELLEEAKEALENAGDYENLENKPQINGHELVGNKTSAELGLQNKLTAGENITIDENGRISATGGTDDYNELINKPSINGVTLIGDKTSNDLGLQERLYPIRNIKFLRDSHSGSLDIDWLPLVENGIKAVLKTGADGFGYHLSIDTDSIPNPYSIPTTFWDDHSCSYCLVTDLTPNVPPTLIIPVTEKGLLTRVYKKGYDSEFGEEVAHIVLRYKTLDSRSEWIRHYYKRENGYVYSSGWKQLHPIPRSVAVNQDGTITFTMSDGSTVTTTGESVIGPQGPAGADGNDYVLTNQDKSDIANLVLAQLPTTQGVQYGNSND